MDDKFRPNRPQGQVSFKGVSCRVVSYARLHDTMMHPSISFSLKLSHKYNRITCMQSIVISVRIHRGPSDLRNEVMFELCVYMLIILSVS